MVNDLKDLMRANVAAPPPDELDVAGLVGAGQRRIRTRRRVALGSAALATAAVVTAGALVLPNDSDPTAQVASIPAPDAPTLSLADAAAAIEGQDYRLLASHTNENLSADNGQYYDGVTADGLILFRDGPRAAQADPRFALVDPATGDKDWLPALDGVGGDQTWPVELGEQRLVLLSLRNGLGGDLRAHVFDRVAGEWSTMTWEGLPGVDFPRAVVGPEDRLYVRIIETEGEEMREDESDFEGDTYRLWSVSLADPSDARDEGLVVGDVAFTDKAMVWTDRTGDAGMIHVRDLATGDETTFDPQVDDRCNLMGIGASGDRIVMGEYCGTYDQGRDDRVQIVSTSGEQVVTLQDDGLDGWLPTGSDVVNVSVYGEEGGDRAGTYVYDLETGRFLRISDSLSQWGSTGSTGNPRQFLWHTPVDNGNGATEHVGILLD